MNGNGNGNVRPLRASRIVRWLLQNAETINTPHQVRIVFDCKGNSVAIEISNRLMLQTDEFDLDAKR